MDRKTIKPEDLILNVFNKLANDWMLLASGDFMAGDFNVMTVGWGSFGTMWRKPFVMVVVRPTRYTYSFMEKFDNFTVSSFPPSFSGALSLCGSKSGRDTDKIKESGLTPVISKEVSSPGFDDAELIIECKKIYFDDLNPKCFISSDIYSCYPDKDYHRMYFGEIVHIEGTDKYKR